MNNRNIDIFWEKIKEESMFENINDYKETIVNNEELKIFFDKTIEYDNKVNGLIEGMEEESRYFSHIELKLINDIKNNNYEAIEKVGAEILMKISLVEAKFKVIVSKIVLKNINIKTSEEREKIFKEILINPMTDNKELIKKYGKEYHVILKNINFYKLVNETFGGKIRNDFAHGKIQFLLGKKEEKEILVHLEKVLNYLKELSDYINMISNYILDDIGVQEFSKYGQVMDLLDGLKNEKVIDEIYIKYYTMIR